MFYVQRLLTGFETTDGQLVAVNPDGTPAPAGTHDPVTEGFTRSGITQFKVAGFMADDHLGDPTGTCTTILDNNSDTRGRIDSADDIDCFQVVTLSDPTSDLVIRATSLSNGMDAVVKVFDFDGDPLIAEFNAANSENIDSGVIGTVAAADLNTGIAITVEHSDSTATMGGYSVSAGATIHSDVPLEAAPPELSKRDYDDDGFFALGPFGFVILLLPLMLMVRRIRKV